MLRSVVSSREFFIFKGTEWGFSLGILCPGLAFILGSLSPKGLVQIFACPQIYGLSGGH